ncbi:phosphotransferase enzyme family protein [Chachezhania antarctica]|uniref:phosphotransferase enzyme family protein n=1 Tax=Chachezhania antarctica TaxID=2340860 RepID=UPI0013CEEA40|nr:phosphotransferase [Chachezhania antarctica]|tara:strand:+ start:5187 stop:6137 length:951 start_codon:yes stop_codon:yes gene_type:complete
MSATVEKALHLWGMEGAEYTLFAARENAVHRVRQGGQAFALRLHREGYRTDAELTSELAMMEAAGQAGLQVPAPCVSAEGAFLHVVDGIQIDLLTWLAGAPVGKSGEPLPPARGANLFHDLGREMARLHGAWDGWARPDGFDRCAWDRAGLLGAAPVWGRFWDNPTLDAGDCALFTRLREVADADLSRREAGLDYGLIHADLVRENVMVDGDRVQLIDFDDAGFGFRLFDVATTLLKNMNEPNYPELKAALLTGYRSIRALDTDALDLFMVLRSATYVGWIMTKLDEDGAAARNARFVSTTRQLAQDYLTGEGATP